LPSAQGTSANSWQGRRDAAWSTLAKRPRATFAQAINLVNVPGIPRTNADYNLTNIQAIANIAAFHFGSIEQGGSSLYATLSQQVSSAEVLKITLSIGGDEICHFLEWVDFAGT
jgi:hypothetical protein